MPTIVAHADHLSAVNNVELTKLKGLAWNKTQFIQPGHTPAMPKTCTLTIDPPVPTAGNNGVTKTLVNFNRRITINAGTAQEKTVPLVGKLEFSVPVGTSWGDLDNLLHDICAFGAQGQTDAEAMFSIGIIPE